VNLFVLFLVSGDLFEVTVLNCLEPENPWLTDPLGGDDLM